ncbi:hypothetical protein FQN57_001243 [Myotisia sp. PD_48]|nr:hypothetical protein FQN57_001243 [Myotisia sp. PD_48]
MTITATSSYSPNPATTTPSFGSRLRRLSQLRSHTSNSSQSSNSNPAPNPRSYRNRLSWVVGRASHLQDSGSSGDDNAEHLDQNLHQLPDSTHLSHLERNSSRSSQRNSVLSHSDGGSSQAFGSDSRSHQSSETSQSSQLNPSEATPHIQPEISQSLRNCSNQGMVLTATAPLAGAGATLELSSDDPSNRPLQALASAAETSAPQPLPSSDSSSNQHDTSTTPDSNAMRGANTSLSPAEPGQQQQAAIRLFSYHDPHQTSRPSLPFTPMTRSVSDDSSVIKVGRYSERDGIPTGESGPCSAPIGFKSKVVSRKHCEFSYTDGQWHIRDVGSSSGTFLNHMRLSQPNVPSRQYAVRDGDIVQLGIDFRGGEEMIFRCVRIRIECNRMWQRRANEFNKNTEALINNLGKGGNTDYAGCRECSICLGSVLRPYQCLFMAACAHVWHYKCIRRLIHSPEYPMFQCPNCRAYTDLNAEVDDSNDAYEEQQKTAREDLSEPLTVAVQLNREAAASLQDNNVPSGREQTTLTAPTQNSTQNAPQHSTPMRFADEELALEAESRLQLEETRTTEPEENTANEPAALRSANIDIPAQNRQGIRTQRDGSPNFEDCPLTPRNDTGPLALDGRAGRL